MKCGSHKTILCEYRNSCGDCLSPVNCFFQNADDANGATTVSGTAYVETRNPSAVIKMGNLSIEIYDKTFTDEQIKNMKEFFGWEVENLNASGEEEGK